MPRSPSEVRLALANAECPDNIFCKFTLAKSRKAAHFHRAEISTCHDGPQPISLAAAISITLSIAPNAEEIEVPRQGRQGRAGWAAARRLETSRARR